MASNTANYNLSKPGQEDYYNIDIQNSNMDVIDAALTPTADPDQAPIGLTGKIVQWVSWIVNRIKAITGKANWYDAPATTLEAAKVHADAAAPHSGHETPAGAQTKVNTSMTAHINTSDPHSQYALDTDVAGIQNTFNSHMADYVRQAGYGTATGTNALVITLNPAPTAYLDGMAISFKNTTQNTGTVTINVNGLGAKSVLKSNGLALASGNLKANSVYTIRYNGSNFILQGEGGDERQGDNVALAMSLSGTTLKLRAPEGIYDGIDDNVTYNEPNLLATNIAEGIPMFGLVGTHKNIGVKSVQRGSTQLQAGVSYVDITISSVDLNKAIPMLTSSPGYGNTESTVTLEIIGYTTLRISRKSNPDYAGELLFWQVVEFEGLKSLQKGSITASSPDYPNDPIVDVTVSSVNISKSILFATIHHNVGGSPSYASAMLINATTIRFYGFKRPSYTSTGVYYLAEFN